ncbi:BAG family molecular chaperone regulator 4-like isoform X1 [Magnolia sinica]|uniref:BAG family molecular chaperone regulator 4-like isoform X1 n=1 Tax=Magnolia sinica TaxID=86752 RepID=UPI00265B417D|nr:BAG family molecular chaperone regulator 4-like isoform X1 [Magnolia sinica]
MEETPNRGVGVSENGIEEIDSELRPIEMLSQKTNGKTNGDDGVWASGPMIKINASHSTKQHQMTLPVHSTFGVKDMSKVVLMEDAASKERKLEEMKRDQVISEALNSVALVRAEVDKLSQKASSLEAVMHGGTKVAEKEFVVLTELFMAQLLKLDSIDAGGEAKVQRQSEILLSCELESRGIICFSAKYACVYTHTHPDQWCECHTIGGTCSKSLHHWKIQSFDQYLAKIQARDKKGSKAKIPDSCI